MTCAEAVVSGDEGGSPAQWLVPLSSNAMPGIFP
jgi:hypothetical protein